MVKIDYKYSEKNNSSVHVHFSTVLEKLHEKKGRAKKKKKFSSNWVELTYLIMMLCLHIIVQSISFT